MRKLQLFAFRISFIAPVFQRLRLPLCRSKLGVIHRDIHRCGKSVWNGKTKAAYTMFSVENGDKRFRGRATHWVRRVQRGQRVWRGARSGPPHIIALALSTTAEAGSRCEPPSRSSRGSEGSPSLRFGSPGLPHRSLSEGFRHQPLDPWTAPACRAGLSVGWSLEAWGRAVAPGADTTPDRRRPRCVRALRAVDPKEDSPRWGSGLYINFTQYLHSRHRAGGWLMGDIHNIHSRLCTLAAGGRSYAGSGIGEGVPSGPADAGCGRKRRGPSHAWALRSSSKWFDYRAGLDSRLTAIGRTSILPAPLCAPADGAPMGRVPV